MPDVFIVGSFVQLLQAFVPCFTAPSFPTFTTLMGGWSLATGRHTVTFFMKAYNAEWDYRFGWGYYSGIVPKEVVAAGPGNWKNVNGTGPFQLASSRPGLVELLAFDGHWGGPPRLRQLVFRRYDGEAALLGALLRGEVDVSSAVGVPSVAPLREAGLSIDTRTGLNVCFLAPNHERAPFGDRRVREALSRAMIPETEELAYVNEGGPNIFFVPAGEGAIAQ